MKNNVLQYRIASRKKKKVADLNYSILFVSEYASPQGTVGYKEYILVIEGTAPPCVFQTFDSPNLSPLCLQYTPLPDCLTEQAGGEVGKVNCLEKAGGCCPFYH